MAAVEPETARYSDLLRSEMSDMSSADSESSAAHSAAGPQQNTAPEATAQTLTELLCGTAERDIAAFAAFYDCTACRTYGLALRVLRDPAFAEETTQQVYLQVWRSAHRFDPGKGSALAWLTALTHRVAVDRVRSERAHSRRAGISHASNQFGKFDCSADEVLDCLDRRTPTGVASLSDGQRASIALAYYGGLTYREVADHLDAEVPTINSGIQRGLEQLRQPTGPE